MTHLPHIPHTVIVALALVRQGDCILLVRNRDVRQGESERYWSLPGGTVEPGEAIDHAAVREVKEETGLDVRLLRLVGLYSKPADGALAVTFAAEVVGGTLLESTDETTACRYFPMDQLPNPTRAHLRQRIEDLRLGHLQAVWRTQ